VSPETTVRRPGEPRQVCRLSVPGRSEVTPRRLLRSLQPLVALEDASRSGLLSDDGVSLPLFHVDHRVPHCRRELTHLSRFTARDPTCTHCRLVPSAHLMGIVSDPGTSRAPGIVRELPGLCLRRWGTAVSTRHPGSECTLSPTSVSCRRIYLRSLYDLEAVFGNTVTVTHTENLPLSPWITVCHCLCST